MPIKKNRYQTKENHSTYELVRNFAEKSRNTYDSNNLFKEGDHISVRWTIRNKSFWWNAEIIKKTNMGHGFSRPCRVYILKYQPRQFYPRGKIMKHCFIDEFRLFDITEKLLLSYYKE
jgi:hypothetical protein